MRGREFVISAGGTVLSLAMACSPTVSTTTAQGPSGTLPITTEATPSTLPDPVSAEGASVVALGEREQGRLELLGGPDWLAEGFGSLWVKADRGEVLRIDPIANAVTIGIPASEDLCQGLGASPEAIWSCSRDFDQPIQVARIDPVRNDVVAVVEVGKSPDQGRLVFAQAHLWVLSGAGDQLLGIDPNTNSVGPIIDLGTRCTDLAADSDQMIWAACPIDGTVVRVDLQFEVTRLGVSLPGARQVTAEQWVFAGFDSGIAQINSGTMEVVAVYDVIPGQAGALKAANQLVWVRRQPGPFLTRINPVAQAVEEVIEAEEVTSGGDVLLAFDSLWATAFDDNLLVRLATR